MAHVDPEFCPSHAHLKLNCKVTLTFKAGRSGLSHLPGSCCPLCPVVFSGLPLQHRLSFLGPLPRTPSAPTTPFLLFKAYRSTFRNFSEEDFVTIQLGFGHSSIPSTINLPDGAEARATFGGAEISLIEKDCGQEEQF